MKSHLKDMTSGSPEKLIFQFSLPLFIGNLFQQIYSIADTMIVGHLLGEHALAAVGATISIYFLLITFLTGASSGFGMIIARYFGAKDMEGIKKAVGASIFLSILLTAFLTFVGLFLTEPILRILQTPEYIILDSISYLRILFGAMAFSISFNIISGFLQALGNSRVPLYILAVSVICNIFLNLWLVAPQGWGMGVGGAALATVLSQLLAAIIGFIYIVKNVPALHISWKHLMPKLPFLKEIFTLAASIGFANSVISIGSVILQTAINQFGVYTIAAFMAARKVFGITFMPLMTTAIAVSTFTSQNFGAGKIDRIKLGLFAGLKITALWSTLMIILAYTVADHIIRIMSGSENPQVIQQAGQYLRISLPFLYALSVLLLYKGLLQGMGKKKIPILTSIIELTGKIVATLWIVPRLGFAGIALAEPLIWLTCAVMLLIILHGRTDSLFRFSLTQKSFIENL